MEPKFDNYIFDPRSNNFWQLFLHFWLMKIFNVEVDTHLREIVRQSGENDRDKKMEEKK